MKMHWLILMIMILLFSMAAADTVTIATEDLPKLKLTGFARARYTWDLTLGKADGFSIPQSRFGFTGAISKDFSYTVNMELTNSDNENRKMVYDVFVDTSIVRNFKIRFGQFKYPFGLEQTTSDADLELINKAEVVSQLVKPSRDIGVQVSRDIALGKVNSSLTLAFINGSGSNAEDESNHKTWVGRLLVKPFSGLSVGGSFYAGSIAAANDSKTRTGLEVKYEKGRLLLKAEAIFGKDKTVKRNGYYFTMGYTLCPSTVVLARFDYWNSDRSLVDRDFSRLTIGVNRFFGKNVVWQTNFEKRMETPSLKNDVFMTQIQVKL